MSGINLLVMAALWKTFNFDKWQKKHWVCVQYCVK
jgi:hypothetical protein